MNDFRKFFPLTALFVLLALALFSCDSSDSFFEGFASASVSLSPSAAQKILGGSASLQAELPSDSGTDAKTEPDFFIEVSLEGGYSAKKTEAISRQGAVISFDEIPAGVTVTARAIVYEGQDESRRDLYSGTSETAILKAGANALSIALKRIHGGNGEPLPDDPDLVDTSIHIYVSATADPDAGEPDGTQEKPFATISAAFDYIRQKNDSAQSYTIDLSGTFNITETLAISDDTESGGPIPAKALALNGLSDAVIDRGAAASSGAGKTAMSVNSSVPVKITNLRITGGYGGGIIIAQGSTVALGDGVLITGNRNPSNGRGGAIHNEGTLFMYGSAVIGDKTNGGKSSEADYTYPVCSSTSTDFTKFANYASSGGGIFNGKYNDSSIQAKLYLGYSGYAADGTTPVKKELTGGLYYNSGESGGALYNAGGSVVYFDSGTIAWNDSYTYGGAVYNDANASIYMSGGKILNNYAGHSSYTTAKGGGVANYNSSSKFIMSGGTINKNETSGNGGGVWNGGKVYMYGSAVIGDSSAQAPATDTLRGNKAESGGGVFNGNNSASGWSGDFYMGYKEDGSVDDSFSGGIYYNYANDGDTSNPYGGGGIVVLRETKISGGTIAYNTSANRGGGIYKNYDSGGGLEISDCNIHDNAATVGGAIYLNANPNTTMTLGGSVLIPAGADKANDISLGGYGSDRTGATQIAKIKFASPLRSDFAALVTPNPYVQGRTPFVVVDGSGASLETECAKFSVRPEVKEGVTTNWIFDANGQLLPLKSSPNAVGDIVFKDGTALAYASGLALSAAQKADAVAVIFYAEGADTTAPLGQKTLGVGLKNTAGEEPAAYRWVPQTYGTATAGYDTDFTAIRCDESSSAPEGDTPYYRFTDKNSTTRYVTGDFDGSDNWSAVCAADASGAADPEYYYPAFNWVNNYAANHGITGDLASGWYMPSIVELLIFYENMSTVNAAIQLAGGTRVIGMYFSSSQETPDSQHTDLYHYIYVLDTSANNPCSYTFKSTDRNICAIRAF